MARSLEQRLADLEKTVMDFLTGGAKKKAARKSRKQAKTSSGRSAGKAKARKTSKRKSAR